MHIASKRKRRDLGLPRDVRELYGPVCGHATRESHGYDRVTFEHRLDGERWLALLRNTLLRRAVDTRGFELNRTGTIAIAMGGEGREAVRAGTGLPSTRAQYFMSVLSRHGSTLVCGCPPIDLFRSQFARATDRTRARRIIDRVPAENSASRRSIRRSPLARGLGLPERSPGDLEAARRTDGQSDVAARAAGYGMPSASVDGFARSPSTRPFAPGATTRQPATDDACGFEVSFLSHATNDDRTYRTVKESMRNARSTAFRASIRVSSHRYSQDRIADALRRDIVQLVNATTDVVENEPVLDENDLYENLYD